MSHNLALVETKRKKIETVWTRSSEALAPAITRQMQLPTELEEIICDFVRDRIRPGLKARLWRDLHRELRFAVATPHHTMFRHPETSEVLFNVYFPDGSWSSVPITALLNRMPQLPEWLSDTINDWIRVAQEYPTNRRYCICCNRRAVIGSVLCTRCTPNYHAAVYAQ